MLSKEQIERDMSNIEKSVINEVNSFFPVHATKDKKCSIHVSNIEVKRPPMNDLANELALKLDNSNLTGDVLAKVTIKDANNKIIATSSRKLKLFSLPYKTNRNTFIWGGKEKSITNQVRLKLGAYSSIKDNIASSFIMLKDRKNLTIEFDPLSLALSVKVEKKKWNLISFFSILGISEVETLSAIGDKKLADDLLSRSPKSPDKDIEKLWRLLFQYKLERGVSYPGPAIATNEIRAYFFGGSIGDKEYTPGSFGESNSLKETIGVETNSLSKDVFLKTLEKVVRIGASDFSKFSPDNRDDARFQDIQDDNYWITYKISEGLNEKYRERLQNNLARFDPSRMSIAQVLSAKNITTEFLNKFMSKGRNVEYVEQTNPLHLFSSTRKISKLGEGGLDTTRATLDTRNLQNTYYGKLDPIETPESDKIGLVLHLSQNAGIKNRTLTTSFYVVNNGIGDSAKTIELDTPTEYNKYIAFNDPSQVTYRGDKIILKNEVMCRYKGEVITVNKNKIEYIDKSPHSLFSLPAALVPFNMHNDGNRMLMATSHQKQAILLTNREEPLVQSAIDHKRDKTYEQEFGNKHTYTIKSSVAGEVTKVTNNNVTIRDKDGKLHKHEKFSYFPLNMNNFINNEVVVKPGDTVAKGDILAEGWQTKNGTLALGKNVRVAFMPWHGYNFEDGVVISESLSKSMESEELKDIVVEIKEDEIGGPGSNIKEILIKAGVSPAKLDSLGDGGIIKKGTKVQDGSYLVGRAAERKQKPSDIDFILNLTGLSKFRDYKDISEVLGGFNYGVVRDVHISKGFGDVKWVITISILMRSPMKEGDKLAGRHGNKSIVTRIEPDDAMPVGEDGKRVDLIFSPLAVPSRKNLGQLYETAAGLIAEKKGKPYKVFNFDKTEKDKVEQGLKEIGYPEGKMTLTNPKTGKDFENKVTVGNMYILKLMHKVDDKVHRRSFSRTGLFNIPLKVSGNLPGEKENPQTLGEMEMRALQAHKAVYNILDATTIKSDGAGDITDRSNIFKALAEGMDPTARHTPETFKVFTDYMKAMGLAVNPLYNGTKVMSLDDKFNQLMIYPAKAEEILRWSKGEVTKPSLHTISQKGDTQEKGGLFDPTIFGSDPKEQRTYWGHVNLAIPMPNPILNEAKNINPYSILLDIKPDDVRKIMLDKVVVVTNPGDTGLGKFQIITSAEAEKLRSKDSLFTYSVSGFALQEMLKEVNVKKDLETTVKKLEALGQEGSKTAKSYSDRDKLYRKYRVLKMLDNRGLQPADLMLTKLPIAPVGIRPITEGKRQAYEDLNKVYNNLISANVFAEPFFKGPYNYFEGGKVESERFQLTKDYYNLMEKVYGVNKRPNIINNREHKGIFAKLRGKEGLVRDKLMSKTQDYSGRSVITVNPKLTLNQVGLPYEIATEVYKPFVIRELVRTGRVRDEATAAELMKISPKDKKIKESLDSVVAKRPILLNRNPSLHKFSIQAFKPVIVESRAIELNPLIVTGFNADFDGDQMGVHVPITENARVEALSRMLPSQNLINPTNGEIIVPLKNEMLLGTYYMTINKEKLNKSDIKKYRDSSRLEEDYSNNVLNTHDLVELKGKVSTVGKHIFNNQIPDKYKDYDTEFNKKEVNKLVSKIIEDPKFGPQQAVLTLDNLKKWGFLAATNSGLSLSLSDLAKPEETERILSLADKKVRENPHQLTSVWVTAQDILEDKKNMDQYKDTFEAIKDKGELWRKNLGKENPAYIMMSSGGKGNPEQLRKMTSFLGLGRDISGRILPYVISSSHKEGLTPQQYWYHAYDSRRGMADRSLSTAKPGELTRLVWGLTQDTIITERDCGDTEGMKTIKTGKHVLGRFLARNIEDNGNIIAKANDLVDVEIRDSILKNKNIDFIYVRSPATCKLSKGVCQLCYGVIPGTKDLPVIGEPVGVLASQAIGEPTTQMTMKTFHTGGVGATNVTQGFARLEELMNVSVSPKNKAVVAPFSGVVRSIKTDPINTTIRVERKNDKNKVIEYKDIKFPTYETSDVKRELLNIGTGTKVVAGQPLTSGPFNPQDLLSHHGLRETQDYLVREIDTVLNDPEVGAGLGVDRKHIELTVGKLTNKAEIIDRSISPFINGQVTTANEILDWNNSNSLKKVDVSVNETHNIIGSKAGKTYKDQGNNIIVKEGEVINEAILGKLLMLSGMQKVNIYVRPVKFETKIFGIKSAPYQGNENWFSLAGTEDIKKQLARGVSYGQIDKLEDPRSRTMTGKLLNIGSGFTRWLHDVGDRAKSRVASLFD